MRFSIILTCFESRLPPSGPISFNATLLPMKSAPVRNRPRRHLNLRV